MKHDIELVKKALRHKSQPGSFSIKDGLNSGSTLLNLACTGKRTICFIKGHYYLYVGDSNSGKTWLCLSALAEAAGNANFNDYDLVYNNVENGALMDIGRYFGQRLRKRLKVIATPSIEEFYYDVDDRIKRDRPFIEILDSMDALTSESDSEKFEENKKLARKGRETKGSYGDGKAKMNSGNLRRVVSDLKRTGSILIIVSQTRDALNSLSFEPKTRAGGRALKFYATLEMWTSLKGHIKKKFKEKDREQGIISKVQVKKNRVTGRDRTVQFPIYHSFGIDDVGACVDFLLEERHWTKNGGNVRAPEFEFKGHRDKLIRLIETDEREPELRSIVGSVWQEIEEACSVKRKSRYD